MRQINVHRLADEARFNAFHSRVLLWCALIIIFDGYDLAVAGIAVPSIMKDMGVTAQNAGFMVSSALFGMMFGAIFLGTIADKIGRRKAIAICIALFSIFTAAAGLTHDPYTFSAMRFLAGLGIGGV
ncbi:MAG TPA: MFS transporter, partial [Pyrinomonadaceae bacterium]|nr:MFS transporter [Pyrinomonadaceae bacterium]